MSWFGVKFLLRASHSDSGPSDDLYEERVILVPAPDERAALRQATEIAESEDCEYENVYGGFVQWRVDQVFTPFELDVGELVDGMEVYSRFYYLQNGREVAPKDVPD